MRFRTRIGRDPDHGSFVTYVPTLGISTFGETREKALRMTAKAIEGYIEAARQEGLPIDDDIDDADWADIEVAVDAA